MIFRLWQSIRGFILQLRVQLERELEDEQNRSRRQAGLPEILIALAIVILVFGIYRFRKVGL
jgi:hypothetical protein